MSVKRQNWKILIKNSLKKIMKFLVFTETYKHFETRLISGITRLPILEGEVSHVEIPRTSSCLGITIVGGSDTPLRCVVVQVGSKLYICSPGLSQLFYLLCLFSSMQNICFHHF